MASPAYESEAKNLLRIFDSIPSLIHTARPDGYLDYFNQHWVEYVGLPIESILGWKWTAAIHPEDVDAIVDKWRFSIASGEPFLHESRVRRADGEYRWMLHHKVAARDELGKIIKWHGSSIDIEERKRSEQQLRRSAQELQKSEFYLAEGQRLAQMGSWALDSAGFNYWSPELFRIYGLDPARNAPTVQEYLDCIHPQDREFMANLITRTLAEALPFDATKRIVRSDGEVRYIRCVGAPVFENQALKKYVGSAIDVTEHEVLTQELQRREAYLAEAQGLSHTGSFGWNPDSGEIVWSDETYRIFEFGHGVKPTIDLVVQRVHPEDRADFQNVIDGACRGATNFEHTYRLLLPDGRVKHVHAIAHASRDESGRLEYVGAAQDVTRYRLAQDQRKKAAEALQASERDLRSIIRTIPTMVWSAAPDGSVDFFNPRWLDYTGLSPDQSRDWRWTAAIHPEDLSRLTDAWQSILVSGEPRETEARLRRFDGAYRWFLFRANPLRDEPGNIVKWYGINLDIEDRKRAEEALRRSESYLAEAQRLSQTGSWAWNPSTGDIRYGSEECCRVLGFDPHGPLPRFETFFQQLHPDDQAHSRKRFDKSIRDKADFELDYRIVHPDKGIRNIHVVGHAVLDRSGELHEFVGTVIDITERKRAEDDLRQAFEDIKKLKDQLYKENLALREEVDRASMFEEIVGTSKPLQAVLSRIAKVAPTNSTVLVTGETGTGKELIARAVHRRSNRTSRAFVSVNCAAIPRDLIASELFGHEKGAFTGAVQRRLGRFEMADGGTIFLDEVGELLPDTQVALLRVLQEQEFERVGGGQPIQVDVRVIAATNRDLQAAVANGSFRQDLFYRLNVFPIEVPPLRERKNDILMLVEYYVQRYANKAGKTIRSIEKKTLDLLQSYQWPGNIRELQNVIERSVILSSGEVLSVDEMWLSKETSRSAARVEASAAFKVDEQRSEREIIEAALAETRGRVSGPLGAAAKLGIPPSTLDHRIKALKIHKNQFKFR